MRGPSATVALAACLVAVGCGAKTTDEAGVDAKGVIVFSGMTSGPYLHAMRPDGSDLRGIALPEPCSPEFFTRDGRTLACWFKYGVQRDGAQWRRVPLPAERTFPDWVDDSDDVFDAQWSPARDRIAFYRPVDDWDWSSGQVTVADADGSNERVVAQVGELPKWSTDGKRLAFARCRSFEDERLKDYFADAKANECSLWTVAVDGTQPAELLVEKANSTAFWSPDGRFIAFFRQVNVRETFGRHRIFIVPSTGGEPQDVGPELVEPSVDNSGLWSWPGLTWLPESAPVVVPTPEDPPGDALELQRCVDIWNRAHMHSWPTGAVNVSIVGAHCQVTVSDYGAICEQSVEMPFRYWCPSHGAGLHLLPPEHRVWNGHGAKDGTISLFDPPKGPRLALPKAPSFPMLDGYVVPFGKDGDPLADLRVTGEVAGTCDRTAEPDQYPLALPDGYPTRCWWRGSGSESCFKRRGRLEIGDVVFCPQALWHEAYDPMQFVKVKVAAFT